MVVIVIEEAVWSLWCKEKGTKVQMFKFNTHVNVYISKDHVTYFTQSNQIV